MKDSTAERLFIFFLLVVYAIWKSVPFGIWEVVGYIFVAGIYAPTLGALVSFVLFLISMLFIALFKSLNRFTAVVLGLLAFAGLMCVHSYIMAWSMVKIGLETKTIAQLLDYPYHWIGAFFVVIIQYKIIRFATPD